MDPTFYKLSNTSKMWNPIFEMQTSILKREAECKQRTSSNGEPSAKDIYNLTSDILLDHQLFHKPKL